MLKVMIADDERLVKKSLRVLIETESEGFEVVVEAENGLEALRLAEQFSPDLIITDIRMPSMDGLELIQQVGARRMNAEFIIISGYSDFAYAQSALRYGVTDYILKPVDSDYFLTVLQNVRNKLQDKLPTHTDALRLEIEDHHYQSMIKEALAFLEQHYAEPEFSVKDAAAYFGISSNYFSTLFKKLTGISFTQCLTQLRIEQAKKHLQKPFIKVYEIGQLVGYEDYTHFSKTFKKLTGCSPSEYRKRWKEH
ncbi:response regulator [Paenibacillus sp. J2TS4]|uniref:response regulator transcription factor n=1 Tax=Paenibacillus sp. J2TS4 TaxID=2807194 RepID=UPI001B0F5D8C|nr:response regulator [Paenibacillus sp. J2TS4]GIP34084.1 DNA-binding response regulator [Paenibacillus sp. J2TS4]